MKMCALWLVPVFTVLVSGCAGTGGAGREDVACKKAIGVA